MVDITSLRKRYNEEVGERGLLQKQLENAVESISLNETELNNTLKARIIIQTVAEDTQKQIEFHISNLVSMALAAVFPDPYTFILRFVSRRNKTEADLLFSKNGNEGGPLTVSGGGPLDVASFALRMAVWSLKPTRNVMFLDEPGKYISRDLQHKFSEMIKVMSVKLGLQFIIISHIPEITEKADKVFQVVNKDGMVQLT